MKNLQTHADKTSLTVLRRRTLIVKLETSFFNDLYCMIVIKNWMEQAEQLHNFYNSIYFLGINLFLRARKHFIKKSCSSYDNSNRDWIPMFAEFVYWTDYSIFENCYEKFSLYNLVFSFCPPKTVLILPDFEDQTFNSEIELGEYQSNQFLNFVSKI